MNPIKRLYIATVGVTTVMAIFNASSALALESTALCQGNELECMPGNTYPAFTPVKASAVNLTFKSALGTIECKKSNLEGETLQSLANPLTVDLKAFTFEECKLGQVACALTTLVLGKLDFLKTGHNVGSGTFLGTAVNIKCGSLVNCSYAGWPVLALRGTGGKGGEEESKLEAEAEANELELSESKGFLCPAVPKWTVNYLFSEPNPMYITK
ncbi:MAG TPA: hypothetical protein VF245_06490 [Solirubrobacterales bacterium]